MTLPFNTTLPDVRSVILHNDIGRLVKIEKVFISSRSSDNQMINVMLRLGNKSAYLLPMNYPFPMYSLYELVGPIYLPAGADIEGWCSYPGVVDLSFHGI